MTALTRQQLHSLKRQLSDAYEYVLDAEAAYHEADDGIAATRCKALTWQLLAEIGYLENLLAKTRLGNVTAHGPRRDFSAILDLSGLPRIDGSDLARNAAGTSPL